MRESFSPFPSVVSCQRLKRWTMKLLFRCARRLWKRGMPRYKLGSGKVYHVFAEKPFSLWSFPLKREHLKDCWQSLRSPCERLAKHPEQTFPPDYYIRTNRKFHANSICQRDTLAIDFRPNICCHARRTVTSDNDINFSWHIICLCRDEVYALNMGCLIAELFPPSVSLMTRIIVLW